MSGSSDRWGEYDALIKGPRRKGGARFSVEQLIAVLKVTEAPCRMLDFWCWWHTYGLEPTDRQIALGLTNRGPLPRFTASVDAAKTMVPAGYGIATTEGLAGCSAELSRETTEVGPLLVMSTGRSLPCAIAATALQARRK